MSTTRIVRVVDAPRAQIYRAFLDGDAIAKWMVPNNMTSHAHEWDGRAGGRFRVTLTYTDESAGKSTAHDDTYHGTFIELVQDERIVESIEFETEDPSMQGTMTMTVTLRDVAGGTEIVATHENIPPGVRPEDNELGWNMSLDKLAALTARRQGG